MALPFQNPMMGGQQPDPIMPPRVPWAQDPAITMASIGLLSGRNLNEGFANLAQTVPAGMAAKAGMQQFMLAQQERQKKQAEEDARRAQMNDVIKNWSGLSPEQRALFMADPSSFSDYAVSTMAPQETYRPLIDPAERAKYGIKPDDDAPYQVSADNKVSAIGGASTNISLTDGKLTEGQSKDVNYYTRGRYSDIELSGVERQLTQLDQSLWSNVPIAGNYALSPEYQTAQRAAREFLAVVLRKDTGAAVTPAEFSLYGPMFIPAPGDSDQVLAAKRKARDRAMDAIRTGLGDKRSIAEDVDKQIEAEMSAAGVPPPAAGGGDAGVVDWQTYFGQ